MRTAFIIPALLISLAVQAEITLTSFEVRAANDTTRITWSTSSELRNAYYIVERSNDGKLYEIVEQVTTQGNLYHARDYETYDVHSFQGRSYYRLSSVDLDGVKTIHGVTTLLLDTPVSFQFSVCSSPVTPDFQLAFRGLKGSETPITIKVLDLNGRIVFSDTFKGCQLEKNRRDIQKLSSVEAGTYVIVSTHEGEIWQRKLVVVR